MCKIHLKNDKKRIIVLAAALAVTIIIAVCLAVLSLKSPSAADNNHVLDVAVITKSSDSSFWKEFIYGIDAAAQEFNINYYTTAPANEEDSKTQISMIEEAINDGVDVIVLSAISAEDAAVYVNRAQNMGIKVIIADSGVDTDNINLEVGTDNYTAGIQLGDAVCELDTGVINVGIVNFDASTDNGQLREQGFRDAVSADKRINIIDAINVSSNVTSAKQGTKEMLAEHPEINVIVTMNEWTTLGVGYAIEDLECAGGVQVYGFDSNRFCIDMLETGYIDGLIVQNPFAMGYLCIENAYNLYQGKTVNDKKIYTDTFLVTRDNLYDTETQKVIFSIK